MVNQVEQIKDRLDVVEVLGNYIKLQKAGHTYKALCPFHNEKSPSFSVSPERQMWYCFGCNEGGDIFTFIEKIEGVEFKEALKILADKAGIRLKKEDPKLRSKREEVYNVSEITSKFFEHQLQSSRGKKVIEYLKERGLKEETIKEWRIGYAPDQWRSLHSFLIDKNYSNDIIESAGLSVKSEKGRSSYHDRFRHRITFPIFDVQGRVIGFSGRVFDKIRGETVGEEAGKYINTPNTLIYDKSRVLYGLEKAKMALKQKDQCLVVEGQLDVILAHQSGSDNTVAVSGTAMGDGHLSIIKRYTPNISLCFDSDEAGEKATRKGAELALEMGLNLSIIELPKGKDVADVIKENVSSWEKFQEGKKPFVQFVINRSLDKFSPKTLEGKKKIISDVLSVLKRVASPVEQEHWLGELAVSTGISESSLREEMKKMKSPSKNNREGGENFKKNDTKQENQKSGDKLEEHLLAVLARYPEGRQHISEDPDFIESLLIKKVLYSFVKEEKSIDKILKKEKELIPILARAEFLGDTIKDEEEELLYTINNLKKRKVRGQLEDIAIKLKQAEKSDNSQSVEKLLARFNKLSQKLNSYGKEKNN